MTKEDFVRKSEEKHGVGTYCYDNVPAELKSTDKVDIMCKKHGVFRQRAYVHLRGSACPKCADEKHGERCRHTTADFVAKAISIHGDKFDYSDTVYVNAKTPLRIYCKKHGYSWQLPNNHLNGHGCEQCAIEHVRNLFTRTKNDFVKKALSVHGNKYDYSAVNYINCDTPVTILCHKHGKFTQKPKYHLLGHGCYSCWKEDLSNRMQNSTEDFIKSASRVHGDKYDYSSVLYVSSKSKVIIKCKTHGAFEQDPTNHLMGQGCPKCWAERRIGLQMYNTDEFIKKAKETHGELYDYSESVYNGAYENVVIKCKKHGKFEQRAGNHLFGQGCPHCKRSFGEERVESFLRNKKVKFFIQYAIANECLLCPNKKILVDFFLPNHNTFIEFNGEQHYRPIKWYGGEEKFQIQKERDYALRQYCKEHKIKLIEIPYTKIDDIENVLKDKLNIK